MSEEPVSLRDRRRAQTEREVGEVALALFEAHGIDATTVDEIARQAGISPRTFFRYFPTKERAALVPHRDLEDRVAAMVDALSPDRPVLPQLEEIWVEVLTAFDDGRSEAGEQVLRVRRLMRTEPSLRLAAASLDEERTLVLVAHLRDLLGDLDDLRARVLVETAAAAVRVALDAWAEAVETGGEVDLVATYARCRDLQHDPQRAART
ncbi:TetR family transcriptional regulator [Nocardioides flavescens]|uniref:TetR family transcriptional regulator n=1 Tax=Nocardioides flavescens TaxID=2691959 RepID=UPI00136CB618